MSVNTLVNNELQRVAGSDSGNHVDYDMQVSTMPEASAQYANLIFQYVGTTDENYTNGYFYKCFVNEETIPTSYTWKLLKLASVPITSYKELQEYWGLGGGGGDANVEPLTIGTNGIYQATTGVDGYAPISVDVYNKYDMLYFSNAVSSSAQGFAKNIISEGYNDIWCVGEYAYSDGSGNHTSLWCSRYPIDTIFPFVSGRLFGCNGSDNYSWVTFNSTGDYAANHLINYDSPYMYIGLKNKDMVQDVLWQSTESSTPNTITLSESIFDYDEVCFFMIKNDGATSATWYLTSELEIGDIIRGYDDTDQSTYTIASNTTLTIATESGYRLYTVYGIKDNSMEKTTLYTNPDDTMPQTIYFSESYTNFDELVIEGHVSGGIVCEQRYPVMVFGRRSHVPADDRIQISTKDVSSWFTLTSGTSMSVDDDRVIIDKVIGINRPVSGIIPEPGPEPGMTRTLLWGYENYSNYTSIGLAYPLLDNLEDYDKVCIVFSNGYDISSGYVWNAIYDTSVFLGHARPIAVTYNSFWGRVALVSLTNTTITLLACSSGTESGFDPRIYKVYGYKLPKTKTRTLLWGGPDNSWSPATHASALTLNDNLSNYDFIEMSLSPSDADWNTGQVLIDDCVFDRGVFTDSGKQPSTNRIFQSRYISFRATSDTTVMVTRASSVQEGSTYAPQLRAIYGIKWGDQS